MDVPTIADDVLHCSVYVPEDEDPAVLLTRIMLFVEQTIPNHIWHRDSFELTLSKEEENMLECIIRVGDSIDDEWLVVYLLWHITKMFQVAVRCVTCTYTSYTHIITSYSVYDADGEFLLIEAADELPSWVRPENVEHRVSHQDNDQFKDTYLLP